MRLSPIHRSLSSALVGLPLLISSCSAAPNDAASSSPAANSSAGSSANAGSQPSAGTSGSQHANVRCQPPPGTTGSPHTIEAAVQLLNALPKPTSVACFVQSLDRPLQLSATSSLFSAQPALSAASPRVFIKLDQLWVSVVVDGDSSYLIEFGQVQTDGLHSIKGEVKAPLGAQLAQSAPFDRVRDGDGTACGVCHADEQPASDVSYATAFASLELRPRPETYVSIAALLADSQACNAQVEPHRCEMLSALFDGGPTVEIAFPSTMPTFF